MFNPIQRNGYGWDLEFLELDRGTGGKRIARDLTGVGVGEVLSGADVTTGFK